MTVWGYFKLSLWLGLLSIFFFLHQQAAHCRLLIRVVKMIGSRNLNLNGLQDIKFAYIRFPVTSNNKCLKYLLIKILININF